MSGILERAMMSSRTEYVFLGWRTVPTGARAVITDLSGNLTYSDGPSSHFLFRQYFHICARILASDQEYIILEFKDGSRQHLPGPVALHFDPAIHERSTVRKKMIVDAGYAVAVYQQGAEENDITQTFVPGPVQFTPTVGDWFHQFEWKVPTQQLTTRNVKFYKVRTVPDQLLYSVQGVRTKDDAMIRVEFMVFYHLQDIETMMGATHDPCGDLMSTLSADVMNFSSSKTFEQFKEHSDKLNKLETFPQLCERMKACGYKLIKVAYRGSVATAQLQSMHDNAIEKRTQLILDQDTELQRQQLQDLKQEREHARKQTEMEMQTSELEHKEQLTRMALDERLKREAIENEHARNLKQSEHEHLLKQQAELAAAERAKAEKQQARELEFLTSLCDKAGLDVTQLLVARARATRVVDRTIEIASGDHDKKNPKLNLVAKL